LLFKNPKVLEQMPVPVSYKEQHCSVVNPRTPWQDLNPQSSFSLAETMMLPPRWLPQNLFLQF
jgi:hypothetical protein